MATINKLRETEKAARAQQKELDELRTKVKAAEDAQLSETERLKKDATEATERVAALERDLREQRISSAVITAAAKLNVVDPDAAYRLLDHSKIEFDASTGQPTNVDALLADLLKAKPYLVKAAGSQSGSATNPARSTQQDPANPWRGKRASIWDPEAARAAGEGVIWDPTLNARQRSG